jgi:hypothetical protein
MSSSTNKKDTKELTTKEKITGSLSTIKSMAIYILLGLSLCYLKIVLGDLARDVKLTHQTFTEGSFVVMRDTTPSVEVYCKENKQNYVKQAFVSNPNFITDYITKKFSTSGRDQLLKFISLEFIYVLLSGISMLDGIPNWVVMLISPIVYGLIFISMFFFMWLMLSYYIFNYFISSRNVFSSIGLGWFVGFIIWLLVMVNFSAFTIPIAIVYGLIQFVYILRKADVRILLPSRMYDTPVVGKIIGTTPGVGGSADPIPVGTQITGQTPPVISRIQNQTMKLRDDDSEAYGFMKFSKDMLLTSSSIQLLICYTIYNVVNYFTNYSYMVIVFFIVMYFIFKGPITFLKQSGLEQNNWTNITESISLVYSDSDMEHLQELAKVSGPLTLTQLTSNVANKVLGEENVKKIKGNVTNVVNKVNDLVNTSDQSSNPAGNSITPTKMNNTTSVSDSKSGTNP